MTLNFYRLFHISTIATLFLLGMAVTSAYADEGGWEVWCQIDDITEKTSFVIAASQPTETKTIKPAGFPYKDIETAIVASYDKSLDATGVWLFFSSLNLKGGDTDWDREITSYDLYGKFSAGEAEHFRVYSIGIFDLGGSGVLYFESTNRIHNLMKASKKLRVRVPFYSSSGTYEYSFDGPSLETAVRKKAGECDW